MSGSSYDHRKRGRSMERRRIRDHDDDKDDNYNDNHNYYHYKDRSRSRSPSSPPIDTTSRKLTLESERQARMARLRAENEQEEARLASLEEKQSMPVRPSATEHIVQVNDEELEGLDEEEQMELLLGFTGSFGSTKNQKVADNHQTLAAGSVAKNKARKYRQYMNRKGGFSRPLDKMD